MKTRIISAAIALILLAAIVLSGKLILGIAVAILATIGIYEFYKAAEKGGYKPFKIVGYLFTAIPLLYIAIYSGRLNLLTPINVAFCVFLLMLVLFSLGIFLNNKYSFIDISITLLGIAYIPFMFSFVTLTRNLDKGYLYFWLIILGAFATDTFAYFTGICIGKTKILPNISPKKSLEGSIGGIVGCVIAMLIFGLCAMRNIPVYHFIILGVLCGCISQIGDWTASYIKRFVGIKDFGNIMPGHGGVLDRFDSILSVAPVIYFYVQMFI